MTGDRDGYDIGIDANTALPFPFSLPPLFLPLSTRNPLPFPRSAPSVSPSLFFFPSSVPSASSYTIHREESFHRRSYRIRIVYRSDRTCRQLRQTSRQTKQKPKGPIDPFADHFSSSPSSPSPFSLSIVSLVPDHTKKKGTRQKRTPKSGRPTLTHTLSCSIDPPPPSHSPSLTALTNPLYTDTSISHSLTSPTLLCLSLNPVPPSQLHLFLQGSGNRCETSRPGTRSSL